MIIIIIVVVNIINIQAAMGRTIGSLYIFFWGGRGVCRCFCLRPKHIQEELIKSKIETETKQTRTKSKDKNKQEENKSKEIRSRNKNKNRNKKQRQKETSLNFIVIQEFSKR